MSRSFDNSSWDDVRGELSKQQIRLVDQLDALDTPHMDILRALIFKIFIDDDGDTYNANILRYYVRTLLTTEQES